MKKKKKSISISIPPVRLFWEDIKEIEEVYKEYAEELGIETDDFEFDSVEELKDIAKDKLSSLVFASQEPFISVSLHPSSASIYSYKDDPVSEGIVAKLKNILENRITPLRYLQSKWIGIILSSFFSISFIIFGILKSSDKIRNIAVIFPISFLILWIVWFMWDWIFESKKHSIIYLINRSSPKHFFSRNKDKIIWDTIKLIIGGLITYLILYLTGQLK